MISTDHSLNITRPVVYDYTSPAVFLKVLLKYYQQVDSDFSIRSQIRMNAGCSPAYISLLLKGKRRLSRDYLPIVARIFQLKSAEVEYIDSLITSVTPMSESSSRLLKTPRAPRNHLLSDWVNVYVKDCINLNNFTPKAEVIYRMLSGISSRQRIEKSISFLYREGFWRNTLNGKTVPDEPSVVTTSGLPVVKIRQFHKAALEIAKKGLDRFPPNRRKAYATVISVNREGFDELSTLVDRFHHELQQFIEKHPEGNDQLCQVTIHLTPLGGHHDTKN